MAAQLLSSRTAKAIELVMKLPAAASFFQTVNDAFDVLNSRVPIGDKHRPLKNGYGLDFAAQDAALQKLRDLNSNMRCGNKTYMLTFQKRLETSIESLRGLFRDLSKINVKYILTARLNQDCLENFFSQIGGLGHFYNNPLPSDVRSRIRLLILSSNAHNMLISSSTSVEEDNNEATEDVADPEKICNHS